MGATSESAKKRWANPEYRAKMSQAAKVRWANLEHREKMIKMRNSSEQKEKHSKACKEKWTDPEHREKMSKERKARWANPEFREKMKKLWANPEYRKRLSKKMRETYADPELREQRSKRTKEQWADPELRAKISGENASNWQGGISKHPYPFEFDDELKQKIRERDEHKCVLCSAIESLCVHHKNYIKADLRPENLITLCPSCHSKTNYNRDYWETFLTTLTEQKKPLKFPLMGMEPLSQDPTYSIKGGINNGT